VAKGITHLARVSGWKDNELGSKESRLSIQHVAGPTKETPATFH